ncbi:uncharacterized protein LOC143905647 [Temnothorax americanus]|uniref:uncharacterized protein LOC143905647 n=1 Tax=Temnothorax americanus TaxID=1964332 RepID=UPI004068C3CC
MNELRALQRASLVNEDPVTCCIYFNKIVNVIMRIISSQKLYNPFGKYRVVDFFKRIEFQNRGSPHAHILVWLDNDPKEVISENMPKTIQLITDLCSVSATDLQETYANQVHKHTFTCYKKNDNKCRFNIPYWPMDRIRILLPITKNDGRRDALKKRAIKLNQKLNEKSYNTLDEFLEDNKITMKYYLDVIRASIRKATVIYKRNMNELWTNTFNPWIANVLNSNMDLQFIIDEYSCAAYVVEYVNKSNRGVSNLHKQLIELQTEHPDQDFIGLMKKVCINLLNTVEMSCQEAAWYLLRQSMSEASREVIFVPTMWASERVKSYKKKKQMDMEELDDDSTDVWTLNVLQKYEQRPRQLEDICLADFAAWYVIKNNNKDYRRRQHARILRYSNYDMAEKMSEYKREMVTLFVPFRCEHIEITDHMKYLQLFDEHREAIMRKFEEYQQVDINKYIEEYNRLFEGLQEECDEIDARQELGVQTMATTDANNDDINNINFGNLTAVVRQRTNVLTTEEFCEKMRMTNPEQRDFLLTLLNALINGDKNVQVFFTGVAGSGKTFTLNLAKEVTNRFAQTHTTRTNAYVACASTGKAAVAIGGTTVHSAFRIAISRRINAGLNRETIQTYRNAFAGVRVVIIDEVSMIGADILDKIHSRMCDITGNFDDSFGGMNVIFCGDLRQLPPVNATPIFKPLRNSLNSAALWQSLNFYALTKVMRQSDVVFSTILTKIGNGERLKDDETKLLESRFRTVEWCNEHVPGAIRLYHRNCEVEKYNVEVIESTYISECNDIIQGYCSDQELDSAKKKLYKLSVTECGGLPYMLKLCVNKPFMVNSNIDVEDGIVNGAIGEIKYLEYDEEDETKLNRVWLKFENNDIGAKLRIKSRPLVVSKSGVLSNEWTPITKRHATISITTKIKCKRIQFPLSPACAMTIHKSQGGTFNEIIYNYHKSQDQQLVYVALSRVTSINGLYLTNNTNDYKFYHYKENNSPKIIDLRNELQRLGNYKLTTVCEKAKQFLCNAINSIMSYNVQSLRAHSADLERDTILQNINLLALNETWLNNDERLNIEGFKWITQFKRKDVRAGGVAIYEKNEAETMARPHRLMKGDGENELRLADADKYGDICAVQAKIDNKKCLVMSVYINPNTSMENIIDFISRNLLAYSPNVCKLGSILEKKDYNDTPIILAGDFNLDVSKRENEKFLELMRNKFGLHFLSNKESTTMGGSCIDMVFTRHVDNLSCYRYISYFSYHKPIIAITTKNDDNTH